MSLSTAVLETLAHLDKSEIPDNLVKMKIEVSNPKKYNFQQWLDNSIVVFNSLIAAKTDPTVRYYGENVLARVLPSVIVPEFNVVLNPTAMFFADVVQLLSVEPFEFDPRLFPESASTQSATGAS